VPVNKLVASVAQLVEQLTLNQLVLGSSPSRGTNRKARESTSSLVSMGSGVFGDNPKQTKSSA
jgi:hypothetical protein